MRWFWIDKFVEFESGARAVAVKNVSLAEEHLHDHFPGHPVMPPALMIEAMAQTGGILVGEMRDFREKVILAKITRATFHSEARPGDQLHLEATVENVADEAATIRGTIRCGERAVAEIELMYSHIDQNLGGVEFPEENFVFGSGSSSASSRPSRARIPAKAVHPLSRAQTSAGGLVPPASTRANGRAITWQRGAWSSQA